MRISSFNNAFDKANLIEDSTTGEEVNALGNNYQDYGDDDAHLKAFNQGLDVMERFKNTHVGY
jgi:hypothetical protein